MAIGESRRAAKMNIRRSKNSSQWSVSTGKIHSYTTRNVYQQQVLTFINWVRTTYGINRLEELDARADECASTYLTQQRDLGRSPYTLATQRSALRLFFSRPDLAQSVELPTRRRELITRSRQPVKQDADIQLANWPDLVLFLQATGLRRSEARALFPGEIYENQSGQLVVYVRKGKGGKAREVHVLPRLEEHVRHLKAQRVGHKHVFDHVPTFDVHSFRRGYVQELYRVVSGRDLPPQAGRLKKREYDEAAALYVSRQLGHERIDVLLRHYLR
jgi:integrase